MVYNFWQDSDHVRGIWRRTTTASYESGQPEWETVIDLDALAAAEKANWVWHGATCARPAERRCLISLSDGGEDADTVREFDLKTKSFVKGGFVLPKGKQDVSWETENSLLVSREWKPGELTEVGIRLYRQAAGSGPAAVRRERSLSRNKKDVAASGGVLRDAENRTLPLVTQATDFFNSKTFILGPKGTRQVAIPSKTQFVEMIDGRVIIQAREEWKPAGSADAFPMGSLLSVDLAALKANPRRLRPTLIYAPGPREALDGVAATKGRLLVSILDNVRGRTLVFTPGPKGAWTRSALELPDNSTIGIADVEPQRRPGTDHRDQLPHPALPVGRGCEQGNRG